MERTYSSLVRHELGSSYSALDGVPFKIGRAFRRPEKINAPEISNVRVTEVLQQEYSFETEEAVLAWAKACNEAVKKASEEQTQRLKLAEEGRKENAKQAVENMDPTENGEGGSSDNDEPQDISVYDIPRFSVPSQKDTKPALLPKVVGLSSSKPMSEPGAVLTPVPIKRTVFPSKDTETTQAGVVASSKPDSQLDLAMFEAEADPFDNLELQTLNDMEELKVLLNSDSVKTNHESRVDKDEGAVASGSCGGGGVAEESSIEDTKEAIVNGTGFGQALEGASSTESNGVQGLMDQDGAAPATLETTCDDGEYVEIVKNYRQQPPIPPNKSDISQSDKSSGTVNGVASHKSILPASGAFTPANSQIYKPVLPPIGSIPKKNDALGNQALPANTSETPLNPTTSCPWKPPSQLNGKGLVSHSPPPIGAKPEGIKPSRPAPPPPIAAKPVLRSRNPIPASDAMSMSSGPSLAMFLGDSGNGEQRSLQSQYSRHCISTSDLNVDSTTKPVESPRRNSAVTSPQPWNRHTPLPPTPSSSSHQPTRLPASQPVGLTDPYSSLSREQQAFTDMLTNMGFLRPRVARAVQKFGTKEKEVLDHLLAVDKLGEQSYAPVMIESALYTFKNDLGKAEKFLRLHTQFEELGFQHDKIHDALVSTDLHHDKALDILTA